MNVTVKYFAVCHEMLDRSEEEMDLPEGATVRTILKRLEEEWPEIAEFYEVMQMSVNWEYATEDTELAEGDEVALIPPVTGGGPMFKITAEVITGAEVREAVEGPDAGAVVLFFGTVRNNTDGRAVKCLEYEAYPPMAEKKMAEIAQEILEKWGLDRVAMVHRVGKLEIGEVSVAVAVASPHRKDGFEACKYAMDRLKQIVPIWKREIWADGETEWVKPDAVFFDAPKPHKTGPQTD